MEAELLDKVTMAGLVQVQVLQAAAQAAEPLLWG
jgi:hypothetical protein